MLNAESRIPTEKASKYLKWLCGHFKIKVPAEYNDTQGTIQFPFGTCQMLAEPDALIIRVQAPDSEAFERIKHVVGDHAERFGRKDAVQVIWSDPVETPQ